MSMIDFGDITAYPCVYCGGPCEFFGKGGRDHVCHHRDFMGGKGHRAHAICCANHVAGRDEIHGGKPCSTIHVKVFTYAPELPAAPAEVTA